MEQANADKLKGIDVWPTVMDKYYGLVERCALKAFEIDNLQHPLQLSVDHLDADIREKNLEKTCAFFTEAAPQVKTISIRLEKIGDAFKKVIDALEPCVRLESLTLDLSCFGGTFYSHKLGDILQRLPNLRHLHFRAADHSMTLLICKAVANNPSITSASFNNCRYSAEAYEYLFKSKSLKTLRILWPDAGGRKEFLKLLESSTTLETLELKPVNDRDFFQGLCQALKSNKSIKNISVGSELLPDNLHQLLTAIESIPNIETLQLPNVLPRYLSNFLANTTTLKNITFGKLKPSDLYLYKGLIKYASQLDLDALATMVRSNKTLQKLCLHGWIMGSNYSLKTLADAVGSSLTLLTLDVTFANFGPDDIKFFAEMIENNKSLQKLTLRRLKSHNWNDIIEALIKNKTLASVDLSESVTDTNNGYNIQPISINMMKNLLEKNTTLREIIFQARYLSESEIADLLPKLKYNRSLTSLDIIAPSRTNAPENETKLTVDLVADVFSQNYSLLDLKTSYAYKPLFEPYLIRNRTYRLDGIILLYNIFRNTQSTVFPVEIWELIFYYLGNSHLPLDTVKQKSY